MATCTPADGIGDRGFWTVVLTGLYPIWLRRHAAHAEFSPPRARCGDWCMRCPAWLAAGIANRGLRRSGYGGALSKETAIAVPLTLALMDAVEGLRAQGRSGGVRGAKLHGWPRAFCRCAAGTRGTMQRRDLFRKPGVLALQRGSDDDAVRILAAFGHRLLP